MPLARLLPLALLALVAACLPPRSSSTLPRGPLASPLAAWIPADVLLAVIGTPGDDRRQLDAALASVGWPQIEPLLADGPLWMVLEAEVVAACRPIGAEPLPAGRVRSVGRALLVDVGPQLVVIRDGVACALHGGATSRREHHALRLAGLGDDERLLGRADARAALAALPDAPLVAWGGGDLIAGISIERIDADAGAALAGLREVAVAVALEPRAEQARITVIARHPRAAEPDPGEVEVEVGPRVSGPGPDGRSALPVPTPDENLDVPESAAYQAAVARLGAVLSDAVEQASRLTAIEARAAAAWRDAWGVAQVAQRRRGDLLQIDVTWSPPAWPIEATRARAAAAYQAVLRAEQPAILAQYEARVAEARAILDELTRIRARDVAAWDRSRR